MIAWRICLPIHAHKALSIESASFKAGRWNYAGVPAIYAASTLSLAALEIIVNLPPETEPQALVAMKLEISESPTPLARHYPSGWSAIPPKNDSQTLGSRWLTARDAVAVRVPSVLLPRWHHEEFNVLINPLHEAVGRIRTHSRPFSLDPRAF